MASIILGSVGGALGGGALGAGIGTALGNFAGTLAGRMIDQKLFGSTQYRSTQGFRLEDLHVQSATYGRTIPIILGNGKIAGNIIWSTPIKETQHTEQHSRGGKGARIRQTHTEFSYSVSLAIGICEGPIDEVLKIWADEKLLPTQQYTFRVYNGNNKQLPDPLIESIEGVGKTPAYRGLAYIVFEDFPLAEYGNRIPNFTFEVKNNPKASHKHSSPENQVKAVTIIPGSGEFVYDPKPQYKLEGDYHGEDYIQRGKAEPVNLNNHTNKTDSILSLDQMQNTLPNLEWAAPVITWFGTSLDIKSCKIKPGVEYKNGSTKPEAWQVGNYNRKSAHAITYDNKRPRYGGTPSDASLIRYLEELKKRKLKVMFYPMLFLDIEGKPWRGHMTGKPEDVADFFNKDYGYSNFILHYAKLVRGHIDAFVIGSELKGVTSIKDANFPAVYELINLAKQVKEILGPKVKVTYAADWSEYHHSADGCYHLDPLWACPFIDFIGIDAYFPLTEGIIQTHEITKKVLKGWQSGEGYEYYYEDERKTIKKPLSPQFAWKNIKWWWENEHINPDGSKTPWEPRMKKIWFTEYGFPSLDNCTNQPNVFFSPGSTDSGLPIHSEGNLDFEAQRLAVSATEKYWENSSMVENKFLWTWDARPYPFWPELKTVWSDSESWSKGHWIQGKFGRSSLKEILKHLCLKSGLKPSDIDISRINKEIEGINVTQNTTIKSIIDVLQLVYSFEIIEAEHKLIFIPPSLGRKKFVYSNDIVLDNHNSPSISIERTPEEDLPAKLELRFLNAEKNYHISTEYSSKTICQQTNCQTLSLPIVLSPTQAVNVAHEYLYSKWESRQKYCLCLPMSYLSLSPGDLIRLIWNDNEHVIRIIETEIVEKRAIRVIGTEAYLPKEINIERDTENEKFVPLQKNSLPYLKVLDLPQLPFEKTSRDKNSRVLLAGCSLTNNWQGINLYQNNNQFNYLTKIEKQATIGQALNPLGYSEPRLIDHKNYVIVNLFHGQLCSTSEENLFMHSNIALIGEEIVQFQYAKMVKPGQYKLSGFLRGLFGTENAIYSHKNTEQFVLLDNNLDKITFEATSENFGFIASAPNSEPNPVESAAFNNNYLKPIAPEITYFAFTKDDSYIIEWARSSKFPAKWRDFGEAPLLEEQELYQVTIKHLGSLETIYTQSTKLTIDLAKYSKPSAIRVDISQISNSVGPGHKLTHTIKL